MADDVFISYRRADERWARQLHARLAAQGIHAWYDVRIGAGQDWRTATASALESAKIFVLLFSTAASESEEVTKELAAATLQKKLIVPVRLEDIQPRGAFLYELAGRNWINAYENTEATLDELARNLAGMLRPASLEAASPSHFDRTTSQQTPAAARRKNTWAVTIAAGVVAARRARRGFVVPGDTTRERHGAHARQDRVLRVRRTRRRRRARTIATSATSEVFDTLGAMNITTAARAETLGAPPDERFVRAQRLGAVYALGGEVLREGPRTTIAIRLEDVATRSTLWSESVSGPASETVPLPVRAAALATDTLRCVSQVRAGLRKADMEVVRLLPRVCREVRVTRLASVAAFRDLLRAAPESPEAQGHIRDRHVDRDQRCPAERATRAARRGRGSSTTRNGDRPAPGRCVAGALLGGDEAGGFVAGAREDPGCRTRVAPESASLNQYLAVLLQASGRYKDALPYGRLAVANDPLSGPKQIAFAELLAAAGLTSEAEVAIERAMTPRALCRTVATAHSQRNPPGRGKCAGAAHNCSGSGHSRGCRLLARDIHRLSFRRQPAASTRCRCRQGMQRSRRPHAERRTRARCPGRPGRRVRAPQSSARRACVELAAEFQLPFLAVDDGVTRRAALPAADQGARSGHVLGGDGHASRPLRHRFRTVLCSVARIAVAPFAPPAASR